MTKHRAGAVAITLLTIAWLALSKTPDFHVYWQAGAALRTGGWTAVYGPHRSAGFTITLWVLAWGSRCSRILTLPPDASARPEHRRHQPG